MHILICTDASSTAEQAAILVRRMNYVPLASITLLGVSESDGDQVQLGASFERMRSILHGENLNIQQKIRYGPAADQILKETQEVAYNLVAAGTSGHVRNIPGFRTGSTTFKLARLLTTPLLVARNVPERIKKILICTAGEASSLATLREGSPLIVPPQAQIDVLHVMSQVALSLESPVEDLVDTAETAVQRGTREGRHLGQILELLQKAGAAANVRPRLRHGLVVDEVLAEIEEGGHDLLVIGGHYHHGRSHWTELLLEDLTGQLLHQAPCSVLVL